MKILWSLPVRGERLTSGRGDLVRANRLIESLRKLGHETRVVEFGMQPAVSVYRQFLRKALPPRLAMVVRDAGRWIVSLKQARNLILQARDFGAEAIVETHVGFAFSGAMAAKQTWLPLILDDCSPSCEEEMLGAGLPWLARRAMKRQIQMAALVIATSHSIAQILAREGIPKEKIQLLPNGIALQSYSGLKREKARGRLGLEDYCIIGFAGSFQPWHSTGLLATALNVLRCNSQWHLLLIGDGPARASAMQAMHEIGLGSRVTAIGEVPPDFVPELIACFDIGVLPGSNDYGHPMKLLEYAAAGVASVAPDLPPVREVVSDFKTGLLFPPNDSRSLAGALLMLIQNVTLRRQLGDHARSSVKHKDDWSSRASQLAAAIKPLVMHRLSVHQPVAGETSEQADAFRVSDFSRAEKG